ncbi:MULTISPECIES: polyphosphate kinase 2 [Luteimonas]|uniref:polyphosphate kinase 2 n=1 Tax=Luteimonas TaxID=83614 RepID=UPI000C7E4B22|nr:MULTISPECIES: polyphosphate kinase 2 [Luteimonas]
MKPMKRKAYEAALAPMQVALADLARWLQHSGQRLLIVFEGRDTAGKGGTIKAISEHLNPRQCHVVALPKPGERERGQWYFQRYVAHLPAAGEIALFDRSWYNRAGVESVMGFASPAEVGAFLQQAPVFEQQLVDDGILLFKYWLGCDQAEQEARFLARLDDPLKRWKLSPMDVAARTRYQDYSRARDAMLATTHTPHAPWTLVDFNDQRRGRLTLIRDLLDRLPDIHVDAPQIAFPPLPGKPRRERYPVLAPLAPFEPD